VSTPDNYRSLFEGSQASLSDMAARQTQALARVGRLRSAIVTVLRKNFMAPSAQAEANLGSRLSDIDDEILLAYLDAFTAAASRGDQRATLQALREAIVALGIPLRGDEPLLWVEQIHQHRQRIAMLAGEPTLPHTKTGHADAVDHNARTGGRPALLGQQDARATSDPQPPVSAPVPVEDYWRWDEPADIGSDAAGVSADNAQHSDGLGSLFADVIEPRLWQNDLGSTAPADDRWTPSPIQARSTPDRSPGASPAVAPETWETGDRPASSGIAPVEHGERGTNVTNAASTNSAAELHETPDEAGSSDPSVVAASAPDTGKRPGRSKPSNGAGEPTPKRKVRKSATPPSDEDASVATARTSAAVETTTPTAPPQAPVVEQMPEAVAPTSTSSGDGTDASYDDWSLLDEATNSTSTAGPAQSAGVPVVTGLVAPMRPELFPGTAPKKRPRNSRAPSPSHEHEPMLLSGTEVTLELNDGMRNALLAAASIPRPVFGRDLVSIAGSLALVDAWEAECRANVNTSPVRFVAPKSRHRLRGCLVAVDQAEVRPTDWWHQAVKRYRAGRLYELGVLLHRVGDEIVSFSLGDHVAVFRLNTPRGLVGIVILLDASASGDQETLNDVAEHMERLLAERLTMIAVLTTSAEPGSLETLVADVEHLAGERSWRPTVPIVAARSWEYADDRGSSALMVLGQG
jgi:hypothetical protein